MIKVEVDQRLQSDRDTKMLVQNLLKNVMNEVSAIKEQQEQTINKILKDVKNTAQESAERVLADKKAERKRKFPNSQS